MLKQTHQWALRKHLKADVALWAQGKGSCPPAPIRMVQNVTGSSLLLHAWCGCAGLALWHCPTPWLLFGSVEHPLSCSVHGGIIPRDIRTIVPVWIKHRTFLLLSVTGRGCWHTSSKQDGWSDPSQAICSSFLTVCTLQRPSEPAILFRAPRTCPLRCVNSLWKPFKLFSSSWAWKSSAGMMALLIRVVAVI